MDTSQIKTDHPLPNVLESYGVTLRRMGKGFLARCPFHDDRHPSFSVFLGRGGWQFKCWGGSCGKAGDVIDFVGYQRFGEGWDKRNPDLFKEVLKSLGARDLGKSMARWKTPPSIQVEPAVVTRTIRFCWEIALSIYGDILQQAPEARSYLAERRLPLDIWRKYRFGYCPPAEGSPLLAAAAMRRMTRADLEAAGLYRQKVREDGEVTGSYEFFKGRLVFADVDLAHNPIYLVGRALPVVGQNQIQVKYLGLAGFAKPLFGYRSLGYGVGPVFLLEGPLDKMTLESWGYDALALMAANPSPEQIRLLQSLKRPIIPVADNDEAGEVALSVWQEAIPWLEKPMQLPEVVAGVAIKDPNDLAAKLPDGIGRKVFADLLKRRKSR